MIAPPGAKKGANPEIRPLKAFQRAKNTRRFYLKISDGARIFSPFSLLRRAGIIIIMSLGAGG